MQPNVTSKIKVQAQVPQLQLIPHWAVRVAVRRPMKVYASSHGVGYVEGQINLQTINHKFKS